MAAELPLTRVMRSDPTPLGALAAIALSRVVAPTDAELAERLRERAAAFAHDLGERVGARCGVDEIPEVPIPMRSEPELVDAFAMGVEYGYDHARFSAANPPCVWIGDWSMGLDGKCEVRPSVVGDEDGYIAQLEVSHRGGDSPPHIVSAPMRCLESAVHQAEAAVSAWHSSD